jgi:hypothetical protein
VQITPQQGCGIEFLMESHPLSITRAATSSVHSEG